MLRYTYATKAIWFHQCFQFMWWKLGLPTILAMIDKGIGNNDFTYAEDGAHNDLRLRLSASSWYLITLLCSITSRMVAAIRDDLWEGPNFFPFRIWTNWCPIIWLQGNQRCLSNHVMQIFWLQALTDDVGMSLYLIMRTSLAGVYVLLSLPILLLAVIWLQIFRAIIKQQRT